MGGAVGHIQHPFDDLTLTFDELCGMLQRACAGELEQVSEKLDGMNIVFTYDGQTVSIARSGGDIAGGGLDRDALERKFAGRGVIQDAFTAAYDAVSSIVSIMPQRDRARVFKDGTRWYSAEVVYAGNANVIHYDVSALIVHSTPVFDTSHGQTDRLATASSAALLSKYAERADIGDGWRTGGPTSVSMRSIADGTIAKRAITSLRRLQKTYGLKGSSTLRDYVRRAAEDQLGNDPLASALASRIAGDQDAPSLPDIKKAFPGHAVLSAAAASAIRNKLMRPIEDTVRSIAATVLSSISSALSTDASESVRVLQRRLDSAIDAIRSSNSSEAMAALDAELARLPGGIVSSAVEGIVFIERGQAYKLTGGFSPVQKILSIARALERTRTQLGEVAKLSSHLEPTLTKSVIRAVLADVFSLLERLGASGMAPIGSTGKRELSGDIDIVAAYDGGRDALASALEAEYGHDSVKRNGSRIVTIEHPFQDGTVQVDIMVGDPNLIGWTRFGPSDDPSSDEHSGVKGMVRNLLLNAVTLVQSGAIERDGYRTRMTLDFDAGLKRVTQKRSGQRWVTIGSELISDDPDGIVAALFGERFTARDLKTFEAVVSAVKRSRETRANADKIFGEFMRQISQYATTSGTALGRNPTETLRYIRNVVER